MKLITDKMEINAGWADVYKMLKRIGFKLVNEQDDDVVCGFQADFHEQLTNPDYLVMVEAEISRNMFCLVLIEAYPHSDQHMFEFWVMEDIGCGWVEMPVRWSQVDIEWLTAFKMAFEGRGFNIQP